MPIRREVHPTSMIIDASGIVQHEILFDREEGEIIHCLPKELIAELFELNEEEIVVGEPAPPRSREDSPEDFDDVDEVEIEDVTEEEYPKYTSATGDDLPSFSDFFTQQSEEELNRRVEEKEKEAEFAHAGVKDPVAREDLWAQLLAELRKRPKPVPPPKLKKVYSLKGRRSGGQIISWAFLEEFRCYVLKREQGLDYFEFANDLKTIPSYEMNRLAHLPLLYARDGTRGKWVETQIRYEYRTRWNYFQAQRPERIIDQAKSDPTSKHPHVILK